MQHERWLSVDEIAAHMGVNPETVYKWIERKKLPAHKMGRLWKFKVSQVDEWVQAGKASQAEDGEPQSPNQGDRGVCAASRLLVSDREADEQEHGECLSEIAAGRASVFAFGYDVTSWWSPS